MSKFSVKKPYTVLVGIVLVLLLGIVAFSNMTPDLLPNIEMPYAVVVTTYVGASPEEVEQVVSKPLEQAMATLDNIKSVSSTSAENYSMVALEFTDEVNMDALSVDVREKINIISGYWSDSVGEPFIIKVNPDMLPVVVAAVTYEGTDVKELSSFVKDSLMTKLESIDGVASVSSSGIIENTIVVEIDPEKLGTINNTISKALNEQFNVSRGQLQSVLSQAQSGVGQISQIQQQLIASSAELQSSIDTLFKQLGENTPDVTMLLEAAKLQKNQLETRQQTLSDIKTHIDDALARQETVIEQELSENPDMTREQAIKVISQPNHPSFVEYNRAITELAACDALLKPYGIGREQLDDTINGLVSAIESTGKTVEQLERVKNNPELIQQQLDEISKELSKSLGGSAAQASASLGKISVILGSTLSQMSAGLVQLDQTQENALIQSDMNNIITLDMLSAVLQAQNFSMPAGYVADENKDYIVRVGDKLTDVEEIKNLTLFDLGMEGLEPVKLSDVAEVKVVDNADKTYAKINGKDGVLLSFTKQSGYATASVSTELSKEFGKLEEQYPGLTFVPMMDQGDYIGIVVDSVLQNLALGAALAILILLLFLRDIRPTLITAISIPVSLTFALVLMYFSEVTLNIISLSGLAVGVGMLVDNSIVVIENVYRLRSMGASKTRAAVSGAAQVASAITSSTLTTVCVFFPIVFVKGLTKQLFTDMALTIGYSLLASLFIALTFVPAASSFMLRNMKEEKRDPLEVLRRGYERSLRFVLRHRAAAMAVTLAVLCASAFFAIARGFQFMPEMEGTEIMISVEMDKDTKLDQTAKMGDTIMQRVSAIEGVGTVGAMQSSGMGSIIGMGGSEGDENSLTMYALVDPSSKVKSSKIVKDIQLSAEDLDCNVVVSGASAMSGYGSALSGDGVAINIYGENGDSMQQAAREICEILSEVEGAENIADSVGETTTELRIIVDKDKAALQGLTVAQVYMKIADLLTKNAASTSVTQNGDSMSVNILSQTAQKLTPDDIRNFEFYADNSGMGMGTTGTPKRIVLGDIAEITEGSSMNSISRVGGRRCVSVKASIAEGYNVSLVTNASKKAMESYIPPDGIAIEFAGENESIMEAIGELVTMLLIGVAIVYLIMVAQFQSLISPFIVMFNIPLAFTGGFLALLITGMEVSVISLIGFVMLIGIIVNNGIVLVDYINTLRSEGMGLYNAIIEAGTTRLRPVLMTALTTILGLLPLAFSLGTGSDLIAPVAVVCVGGLIYATIMTLFVIPVMYSVLNKKPPRVIKAEDLEIIKE